MRARLELFVAGLSAAIAVALHALFFLSAGPLWRDEVVTLHVATSPFHLLWQRLQFESFPLPFSLLVRAWCGVAGESIASLRLFGVITGLAIIAACWIAARTLGSRTPAVAIALVALNASVVRYGDSLRGYGWSIVAGLLSVAAIYRAVATPSRRAWMLAAVAAIASVQSSFHNSVLLAATCIAAAALAREQIAKLAAVAAAAAVSLLPYVPAMRARAQWTSIETYGVDFSWIVRSAFTAAGLVDVLAIAVAIALAMRARTLSARFALLTTLLFAAGQLAFIKAVGYAPQPWYFVLLIAVAGVCADAMSDRGRVIIAVAAAALSIQSAVALASQRASNVDVIAAATRLASPDDVVIVYPWYCGISFNQYARGAWTTLPPLADHTLQRYDLLLPLIAHADAVKPVVDGAARGLQSGHTLWIAGLPLGADSAGMLDDPRTAIPYVRSDAMWCDELRAVIHANAHHATLVVPPDPQTSIYERMQLIALRR